MTHDDFLDPGTAERLLDGTVAPADAPPGFGPVADLLDAARGGVTPPAADLGALASAARAGAGGAAAPDSPTPGRPPVLAKFLTLKAAAVAGVVLLGATSAAAATGALPGPLQRTAHRTLSHVGVNVPTDDDDDATDATEAKDHDATEVEHPTTTSTTLPDDLAAVPPSVPTSTPEADDDHGGTEVEDESDDDHGGTEVEDEADDDHGGTTVTTRPSSGGGSHDSDDDGDDDHSGSGSGSSGSGSSGSGSGSSGHGGGED